MREACDTGSKSTAYIGINESHLCCLVVVLVMHIMDHVQGTYIEVSQPVHHSVVFLNDLIIIQILGSDRLIFRSYLIAGLLINTAVDCVE